MANKKTRALTDEHYERTITSIKNGFIAVDGSTFKPNNRLATILTLEANLGLRISDILHLPLCDIIQDGNRYRLDISEMKTNKKREFTVPMEIYSYLQAYALNNRINPKAKSKII